MWNDVFIQDDVYDNGELGDAGSPPTIVSSPPLDIICAPTPEPDENGGVNVPETETPAISKEIKVYFVIIFSGYTNETFDEASQSKLVEALRNATLGLGAKNIQISIKSIEDMGISRKRRRRNTLALNTLSTGVKVQAEANFDQQDEDIAVRMMQILTDSPSSIFPLEDFGEVNVPQIEIVKNQATTVVLPIVLGVLGGLLVCMIVTLLFIRASRKGYQRDASDRTRSKFHPYEEQDTRSESMSRPQISLLQSISSKDYSSSQDHVKPGVVINNIGAGFL